MEILPPDQVERVLVITAHPDDVDFGAAGTIAGWTDAGAEVTYCIVTDGDAGGFDPSVPRSEIGGIRRREQTAAAKAVGVDRLHFLGYPDGALEVSMGLRKDLARVIRQERPRRVITQSPLRTLDSMYRNHPDHLAAGEAALCAVYPDARNPFTFTDLLDEGHEAWSVEELWVFGSPGEEAATYVDITEQFDRKIEALACHESQITDPAGLADRLREWNGANARFAGLPEGAVAECFRVMDCR